MTSPPTPEVISGLLAADFAEYDPDDRVPFGFHVYKAALGPETIVELCGVDLLPFNPGEGPRALLGDYAAAIRLAGYAVRETGSVVVVPVPVCPPSEVLCSLADGDLITIQWSGQLRTVAVAIRPEGVALRDLTEDEMAQLDEEAARYAEEIR